jgi:hypothetical protein
LPVKLTDSRDPLRILYYGDGGTGKTVSMCGMAHLGPILVINAENGLKLRALRNQGVPVENIELWPPPGEPILYSTLEEEWLRIRELLHTEPDAYAGVVIDSVTELTIRLLDEVRTAANAKAQRTGRARDEWSIELADYGVMTEQVRWLMRRFTDLPCHLAMSALARRDQDHDGQVAYGPAVTPALQINLRGWMDLVCWTSVGVVGDEEEYRGCFRHHGKYEAKDRYDATPKWLIDPSFDRVLAYVNGELTDSEDERQQAARERARRVERAA